MRLARKYMQDPTFNPSELSSYSIDWEYKLIQKYLENNSNPFHAQNGWFCLSFNLCISKEGVKFTSKMDPNIPTIPIKNVIYRSITHIMKTVLSNTISSMFHLTPFKQYWTTADGCNICVHSECFTSPRMLNAYEEINSLPREPGDEYKQVVAPLMLWSDVMQLANLSDTSLWPVYLYFGNQSTYTWGKPMAAACHHIVYIPSVSILSLPHIILIKLLVIRQLSRLIHQ